jgi:hypothetical protein
MSQRINLGRIVFAGLVSAWLLSFGSACSQPLASPPPPVSPAGPADAAEPLGRVLIRIAGTGAERTLYPEIPPFTGYAIGFAHDDGETAPEAIMEEGETLQVELKTGFWTITATALIEPPGGGEAVPLLRGENRINVEAGEPVSADISLDRTLPGEGEAGRFSYTLDFPRDRLSSAVLTLSLLGNTGTFVPQERIDLLAGDPEADHRGGTISLPAGYYRMDLRLAAIYPFAGKTEILHIYPGLETAAPPWVFTGEDIPPTAEIHGTTALKEYLAGLPPNTAKTPYPVKLSGVDLGSVEKTGETLWTLCKALSRFTALDLRDCWGTAIKSMTKTTAPNKVMIVSLILPDTVIAVEENGFSGYDALVSVEAPGLTTLDKGAFKDCTLLESVSMPELTTITAGAGTANGVFRGCTALKWVFLPKAEAIGDYAFYKCDALSALSLPAALSLGKSALRYAASLSAVSLPSVETIGNYALADCPRLDSFSLGSRPPALEGKNTFTKDMLPRSILVPAAAVELYTSTTQENWTNALKERVRAAQ